MKIMKIKSGSKTQCVYTEIWDVPRTVKQAAGLGLPLRVARTMLKNAGMFVSAKNLREGRETGVVKCNYCERNSKTVGGTVRRYKYDEYFTSARKKIVRKNVKRRSISIKRWKRTTGKKLDRFERNLRLEEFARIMQYAQFNRDVEIRK
jgi:hypothetical protein